MADTTTIDTRVEVETPEHVAFRKEVAGPGSRGVAWALDTALRAGVLLAIATPILGIAGVSGMMGAGSGVLLVAWFLLDWGWFTAFEAFGGASPGKRIMGLRVVREDGSPAGLREIFLRNLLRAADGLPVGYVVGVLAMGIDPRFRRLGDRLAGTLVVRTAVVHASAAQARIVPPLTEEERRQLPTRPRVHTALRRALEAWLETGDRIGPIWLAAAADRAAKPILTPLGIAARTQVRGLQMALAAARAEVDDEGRFVARRQLAWRELARELDMHDGFGRDAARLGRIVRGYRDLCADLGRFRDAAIPAHTLDELEALCARAHAVLYARPVNAQALDLGALGAFLFRDFPATLWKNRAVVAAAAALLFVPLVATAVLSASRPDFAVAVLPAETRVSMEAAYSETLARSSDDNAMMAGFYVDNNVGIALRAAAAGIFLGIGSAWVLLYNGVVLGAVAGYLFALGHGGNLLRYTSGHTPWELGATVIAGAAGLRLGIAIVVRHGRTVTGSLRAVGAEFAQMTGGAACMLLIAASIEGFWSGSDVPDAARAVFALGQYVLVAAWLSGRLARGSQR